MRRLTKFGKPDRRGGARKPSKSYKFSWKDENKKERKCLICGTINPLDFRERMKSKCRIHEESYLNWNTEENKKKRSVLNYDEDTYIKYKINHGRLGAKRRGIDFNLTYEDLRNLIKLQDNKCAYTKITFDKFSDYYSMSIDRIDSSKGYLPENIQLVCWIVNIMKHDLEESHFLELCKSIYLNNISE